jgi:hypothetical protein
MDNSISDAVLPFSDFEDAFWLDRYLDGRSWSDIANALGGDRTVDVVRARWVGFERRFSTGSWEEEWEVLNGLLRKDWKMERVAKWCGRTNQEIRRVWLEASESGDCEVKPNVLERLKWDIRHPQWELEEDSVIVKMIGRGEHWEEMSAYLDNRPADSCRTRYHDKILPRMDKASLVLGGEIKSFTKAEDSIIVEFAEKKKSWGDIASHLPHRSAEICLLRYGGFTQMSKPMMRPDHEPWTQDDNELLRALGKYDFGVPVIAERLGRTPDAVRKRWDDFRQEIGQLVDSGVCVLS